MESVTTRKQPKASAKVVTTGLVERRGGEARSLAETALRNVVKTPARAQRRTTRYGFRVQGQVPVKPVPTQRIRISHLSIGGQDTSGLFGAMQKGRVHTQRVQGTNKNLSNGKQTAQETRRASRATTHTKREAALRGTQGKPSHATFLTT